MKKTSLLLAALFSAALLFGADWVITDLASCKTTGTVKIEKKKNLLFLHGNMQGGEIRIPVSAAALKNYKFLTVDRRHQSGDWQMLLDDNGGRITLTPVNPGAIKLNYRIDPVMAKNGKNALFCLKVTPGVDMEIASITFSAKAAKSGKYVQRTAKGPRRVFDTPVGKFTIPATYEDITPKVRREKVNFKLGKNDSGLRSYVVDNLFELNPKLRPSKAEFDRHLTMFAAPGQFEGAAFSVYAVKNAPQTLVTVQAAVGSDGAKLPVPEVRYLRVWPQRKDFTSLQYRDVAELLEREVPKDIAADTALAYYLKVHVPENTKPGLYKGKIEFKTGNFPARTLDYTVRVTSLKLDKEFNPVIGCYYGSPDEFAFIKSFGINSVLQGHQSCMRGVLKPLQNIMTKEKNVKKRLEMLYDGKSLPQLDFNNRYDTCLDKFLKSYKASGYKTVVCWFAVRGFTDVIAKFLDIPLHKDRALGMYPETLTPEYRKLFKECIKAVNEHAAKQGVRIYWYQFDELGINSNIVVYKYAVEMFKLVKECGGYTAVTCSEDEFTDMVSPYLDMRIYAASSGGDATKLARIRKSTKKANALFYSYTGSVYENHYYNRYMAGWNMWLAGWEGRYFWNLHSQRNNVWNDFDHANKDSMMVYNLKKEIIPTLQLETLREGIDDFRYLVTVEKLAAKAAKSGNPAIKAAGLKVQKELAELKRDTPISYKTEWDFRNFERYRWRISCLGEYLQNLLDGKSDVPEVKFFGDNAKKKSELTFPAVLRAPRTKGKITVDGDLSDPGWKNAFLTPALRFDSGKMPEVPTNIKLARDDKYLYIGFQCIEPDTTKLVRHQKIRDHLVWRDDCIEIFYDGKNDHRTSKHLIVNSLGNVCDIASDGKKEDFKWNCPGLLTAAKVGKGEWTCEVGIPLSEFSSAVCGLNMMRTRVALLSHVQLAPDVHNPRNFPKLCFADSAVPQVAAPFNPKLGINSAKLTLPQDSAVTVKQAGKILYSADLKRGKNLIIPFDLVKEGENTYSIAVLPQKGDKMVWSFTEFLPKALTLAPAAKYYFANEGDIRLDGKVNVNNAAQSNITLKVSLINGGGAEVCAMDVPVQGSDFSFRIPAATLTPESFYTANFQLITGGTVASKESRTFFLMPSI